LLTKFSAKTIQQANPRSARSCCGTRVVEGTQSRLAAQDHNVLAHVRDRSETKGSRKPRTTVNQQSAFLNIPFDAKDEDLFVAFIAGLCTFGLVPHTTLELTGSQRRLDRIVNLIRHCRYSFHDLSRVELDRTPPSTPRFNMPFELGLAVDWTKSAPRIHDWFVFEAVEHRLPKSLSDLNGTDPHIHHRSPDGVLRALTNVLSRVRHKPSLAELRRVHENLRKAARKMKVDMRGGSLFEARPFQNLVALSQRFARAQFPTLKS
jgi:hypothetical protein